MAFIEWLEERRRQIAEHETRALEALNSSWTESYAAGMRKKAEAIAALADEAAPYLAELPPEKRAYAEKKLRNFSRSAKTSLSLDSVFYMSALLYPDDHKKGQPDNLAVLIAELKS